MSGKPCIRALSPWCSCVSRVGRSGNKLWLSATAPALPLPLTPLDGSEQSAAADARVLAATMAPILVLLVWRWTSPSAKTLAREGRGEAALFFGAISDAIVLE